tara:strand:+ start:680 stop:904 length:225 start_codon:yes stop_codon:yes gene_type:complete
MSGAQEALTVQDQAECASVEALNTVYEVFGHPDDDRDTTLIREWKNGGAERLRRRLQRGDFEDVPDVDGEENAR